MAFTGIQYTLDQTIRCPEDKEGKAAHLTDFMNASVDCDFPVQALLRPAFCRKF